MAVSRRRFLGCAAGVSVAGLAGAAGLVGLLPQPGGAHFACVLVSPGASSPLRESVAGFEAALASLKVAYQPASFPLFAPGCKIIMPATITTDAPVLESVREHLENGSVILYESGAAFLGSEEFGFQKRMIKSVFGLSLHGPTGLWDSADSFKQSPYIDYHWPVMTKVRDFSRVIPVDAENGETIARFGNLPVAARHRIGKGTLVFLGSPLGPHLLTADREATCWLKAFCSLC